jgi:cytochrome P450
MTRGSNTVAALPDDPFCDAVLAQPYPFHERLRDAGPVAWLSAHGVWASARHAEVHLGLTDWKTFSSAAGVGLADFGKETPWRPPSLVLEVDPPLHERTRPVLAAALSPAVLKSLREAFEREAQILVEALARQGDFDAVSDLAEVYPIKVFADAVGLPIKGRHHLLTYAATVFNAFGPRNAIFQEGFARAAQAREWVAEHCKRHALSSDGIGARVFAAVDRGEITETEGELLVRSLLSAGLDTTVHGLANSLWCLAAHPDQWARLRADPTLARAAFEESLRFESPVQTFFRTTTKATELGGVRLEAGQKILLFLGGANRDPARWERPDVFDIGRKTTGHLAFGAGIHGCVGQMIARMEGEIVLAALARRVETFALTGPPRRTLNNTLRAMGSLPVRVTSPSLTC